MQLDNIFDSPPFADPHPSRTAFRLCPPAVMPSKYVAKSYVGLSVAKMSKEKTAETERTISETKEGLQIFVRPIIDRLN